MWRSHARGLNGFCLRGRTTVLLKLKPKRHICQDAPLRLDGAGRLKLKEALIPIQKNNLTSLSRLAVLSVLFAARRLVSLLF